MSQFYKDSIFWIEVDKIKPNPFQPRPRKQKPVDTRTPAERLRDRKVEEMEQTIKTVKKHDAKTQMRIEEYRLKGDHYHYGRELSRRTTQDGSDSES